MASTNKKRLFLNSVAVDFCCISCRKPNSTDIFHPKPKSAAAKHLHRRLCNSNSSSTSNSPPSETTASSFSPAAGTPTRERKNNRSRSFRGSGRIGGESVAVEKDSDDPYLDFRRSMLQMILEKEIYSKDDLKELLNCFLQLNSPCHHGIIVRAFAEIWNGVYSVKSSAAGAVPIGFRTRSPSPMKLHCYYDWSRDL